nr:MAG TPA: hypothetical protein [Caudoviricetes sp.]
MILQATVAIFSLSHFALAFFFDSDTGIVSPLLCGSVAGALIVRPSPTIRIIAHNVYTVNRVKMSNTTR